MVKIAVFVSGGGTNLQALIDAAKAKKKPDEKPKTETEKKMAEFEEILK